jgi:hypothetical protein
MPGCILRYMFYAQQLLQSQLVSRAGHSLNNKTCFYNLSASLTENTHSLNL